MNTAIASTCAPAVLGGVTRLPARQQKAAVRRVAPARSVCRKVVASSQEKRSPAQKLAVAAPAAGAAMLAAVEAHAADIVAAQPQEVAELAIGAPVFYVGFLAAALGSTIAVYLFLTKIELI